MHNNHKPLVSVVKNTRRKNPHFFSKKYEILPYSTKFYHDYTRKTIIYRGLPVEYIISAFPAYSPGSAAYYRVVKIFFGASAVNTDTRYLTLVQNTGIP